MKKSILQKFISKYSLGGEISAVKWIVNGNKLEVNFASQDKNVVGFLSIDQDFLEDGEYNILETDQMSSLISILSDEIKVTVKKENNIPTSLLFTSPSTKVTYVLADSRILPKSPSIKTLPPFDVELTLDSDVMTTFMKAKAALNEEAFTVITHQMPTNSITGTLVIGHSNHINKNNVRIEAPTKALTPSSIEGLNFSAKYLHSIFSVNKELMGTMFISNKGLCKITFDTTGISAVYYLSSIMTE